MEFSKDAISEFTLEGRVLMHLLCNVTGLDLLKNAFRYTLPSQQHFYMETQSAVAEPQEGGAYTIHASTQTLDGVQAAAARALGIAAHNITAGQLPLMSDT